MTDTVTVKLPVSGSEVELRNYTTNDDDEKAESILYLGVNMTAAKGGKEEIVFPVINVEAAEKSYVPRLVKTIDGDSSNLELRLKEMRSEDYLYLRQQVTAIVDEHSPKVKAAKKKSAADMTNK